MVDAYLRKGYKNYGRLPIVVAGSTPVLLPKFKMMKSKTRRYFKKQREKITPFIEVCENRHPFLVGYGQLADKKIVFLNENAIKIQCDFCDKMVIINRKLN